MSSLHFLPTTRCPQLCSEAIKQKHITHPRRCWTWALQVKDLSVTKYYSAWMLSAAGKDPMWLSHPAEQGDGKGEARDWRLLQQPVSLLRAAARALRHLPPGTWMRLAALYIHCLRQLSLHLPVSATVPSPCSPHRACGRVMAGRGKPSSYGSLSLDRNKVSMESPGWQSAQGCGPSPAKQEDNWSPP